VTYDITRAGDTLIHDTTRHRRHKGAVSLFRSLHGARIDTEETTNSIRNPIPPYTQAYVEGNEDMLQVGHN